MRRRALFAHVLTYGLAFVPALVWLADDIGGWVVVVAAAIVLPHLVQDDGRVIAAWARVVKHSEMLPRDFVTIAVDPDYQGNGVGELLLLAVIDRAQQIGAHWLTLEVRVTNHVAQALYEKYTFKEMGLRRRYYSDNGEDAIVMWTDPIESDTFQEAVRQNRERLARKMGQI